MLKISRAGCLGRSAAVLVQFTVEMCAAAKSRNKNYQNALFWGFEVVQSYWC